MQRPGECSLAHRGVLLLDEWERIERRLLKHMLRDIEKGESETHRTGDHTHKSAARPAAALVILTTAQSPRRNHKLYRNIRARIAITPEAASLKTLEPDAAMRTRGVIHARTRALQSDERLPLRLDREDRHRIKTDMDSELRHTVKASSRPSMVVVIARSAMHLAGPDRIDEHDVNNAIRWISAIHRMSATHQRRT